jgi:hypothetical protein
LGAVFHLDGFLLASCGASMRACFLGQNIGALGFGVAMVQSPPMDEGADAPAKDKPENPPPGTIPENRMVRDLRRRDVPNNWG